MSKQSATTKAAWVHNPDWEKSYHQHWVAYDTLLDIEEPTAEQQTEIARCRAAYERAYASQFKTAADYIDNKVNFLKRSARGNDLPWMTFDTTALTTKKQADTFIENMTLLYRQQRGAQSKTLPIASKPKVFQKGKTDLINAKLYLPAQETHLDMLMCVEKTKTGLNVCLSELYTSNTRVNLNTVTEIVTNNLFEHNLNTYAEVNDQKDINWFIHVPAAEARHKESFIALKMSYEEDGRYRYGDFQYQTEVPEEIRLTEFKNTMGMHHALMIDPRKAHNKAKNTLS